MAIKRKIFNDPLYGLIRYPYDLIYQVIDHPYFQRLRLIRQLGLSSYVYTGATHTRFHHALGVAHLADRLSQILISKGINITEEEHLGVVLAALLHDVGHGPFSHVLEQGFIKKPHEDLSVDIMKLINKDIKGGLDVAIKIFTNQYHKEFLHQMISSQLDVDRLDYLTRDSYYTGVVEGMVGYNRILEMMNVFKNRLVVEEKGLYSVEKFILARRFMYMQVYLHKVVIVLDEMLKSFLERYYLVYINAENKVNRLLNVLRLAENHDKDSKELLKSYLLLDDIDIFAVLKDERFGQDKILKYLSSCILDRELFTIQIANIPMRSDFESEMRRKVALQLNLTELESSSLVKFGFFRNLTYAGIKEIEILKKTKSVVPISHMLKTLNINLLETAYYACYPKNID